MPHVEKLLVFLASPGDVPTERRYVEEIITDLNRTVASDKGVILQVVSWENDAFPGYGQDAQALINAQIAEMAKHALFVGIMWNRLGTPTPRAASGTVEEFERAVEALKDKGQPDIWFYFRQSASKLDTEEQLEQRKKVLAFKKQVQANGLPWTYKNPADFRDKFRNQMMLWLNTRARIIPDPTAISKKLDVSITRTIKRRIYISMPADIWLDNRQNELKWGIVDEIEKFGYEAQVFSSPTGGRGLVAGKAWNLEEVDKVMRRCVGAAIIGLPRFLGQDYGRTAWDEAGHQEWRHSDGSRRGITLPTDYCHYEGAVAYTYGLPILAVVEEGIEPRVIFNWHVGLQIIPAPQQADRAWLKTDFFRGPFENWKRKLEQRRDIFLGYCSSARGIATNIKQYLKELDITVLDWHDDFAPSGNILAQVHEAASCCSAGIFLFTKDDIIVSSGEKAAPRDNVVFEAGFVAHAKGKERVLIIREKGSKMPAHLGGDIYAFLADSSDIMSVKPYIKRFIDQCL